MIDPNNVINFKRTQEELEEFLLFCVVVAGKNADQQAAKLERFLAGRKPFAYIRSSQKSGRLDQALKDVRLGKYSLLGRSFRELAFSGIDLSKATWEELARFPGIGMKTAKFFILHSRERQMHGVLDTHVLAWMAEHWAEAGPNRMAVPRHSPQDPKAYRFWETVYFGMVSARHHGTGAVDWAHFDLELWRERRGSAD
jgi:thermostable 8-oxoguanine DNA glycosylase